MGKRGKLFVISAPSGTGKTTLCQKLIQSLAGKNRLVRSISATTRAPRKGEQEAKDYFFISQAEFRKRRKAGQFLEWAKVLGQFYGTPAAFVDKCLKRGEDVLLSIDVQGAGKIRQKREDAVLIFILPPSLPELKKRLTQRSTESSSEIARRLKLAREEIAAAKKYDYVVLNDKISQAVKRLQEIIQAERTR